MIDNIIVNDDRGREFVSVLRSAADKMRASVSKFNEFCEGKYWRSVDGWCKYRKDGLLECYYFGSEEYMHNGCPVNIGDTIIFRYDISDCYYRNPNDCSPFYVSEHVVVGFDKGLSGTRISLSKKVKDYKVIFDSSENKYKKYESSIGLFALIFGIITISLFIVRYFIDINIFYPLSFLLVEILLLRKMLLIWAVPECL